MRLQIIPDEIKENGEISDSNVTATKSFTWTISLHDIRGKCAVTWTSTANFRPQLAQVVLYTSDGKQQGWGWATALNGTWTTETDFGPGWYAELVAQDPSGVPVVVLKTPVT